ncbi:MAG: thiamine phosphate synthase [Proteobacteria bacterium]|nr:thiamine phosphate synthase [Pseudomonadota bacterium]
MSLPDPPILLITDRKQAVRPLIEVVAAAFDGGCRWVMLREKDLGDDDRLALLHRLLEIAQPYNATVIVNGDLEAALSAGAHGVHLPQKNIDPTTARERLGENALIGVSTHTLAEAQTAAAGSADYITLSPVHLSPSKPGYGPALTPDGFAKIAAQIPLPVLALGGVEAANTPPLMASGAAGIAIMGTIMRADNPTRQIASFIRALRL